MASGSVGAVSRRLIGHWPPDTNHPPSKRGRTPADDASSQTPRSKALGGPVPANRSRTEKWRDSLQQIADRGGGLEFSVAKGKSLPEPNNGPDLVWRVRLLGITDTQLLLEQPVAVGSPMKFEEGMELVAVMSVGQNRWMFHT